MAVQNEPIPQSTTYYAVYVQQDDPRPVLIARYENLATSWAANAYDKFGVKYEVRPVRMPLNASSPEYVAQQSPDDAEPASRRRLDLSE